MEILATRALETLQQLADVKSEFRDALAAGCEA